MRSWSWLLLSLMVSCVGTRTGNPGSIDGPEGADVAKSNLARATDPQLSAVDVKTFGADNRDFALALYKRLAQNSDNLFFSPYNISTALAMTYAGANADTASEMETALHFSLGQSKLHQAFNATAYALAAREMQLVDNVMSGDGLKLSTDNQAWSRKGVHFLDSYLDLLAQNYAAGLFLLDFSDPERARAVINRWVAQQTHERVPDVLPAHALGPNTPLVLTSVIYFKGSWLSPFAASLTDTADFHSVAGDSQVQMMHASASLDYAALEGFRMVKLPYLSKAVSLLAVLPPEGDLQQAAQRLDARLFDALVANLSSNEVHLGLPKWQFTASFKPKETLLELGMHAAFDPSAADFSKMTGSRGLFIQEIYHQAFVAVDEYGTEAAAATAVVFGDAGVSFPVEPPVELKFDRPFMFAIYDEPTGQILFMGQVTQPAQP
jgi:serpin B